MRCLVGNIEKVRFFLWEFEKKIVTSQANLFLQNKIGVLGEVFAPIFCTIMESIN